MKPAVACPIDPHTDKDGSSHVNKASQQVQHLATRLLIAFACVAPMSTTETYIDFVPEDLWYGFGLLVRYANPRSCCFDHWCSRD